jgi:hypothetical protein
MPHQSGNISKYWFWLVIIGFAAANLPFHYEKNNISALICYYQETMYRSKCAGFFPLSLDERVICLHAIASTILAVACHLLTQIHAKRTNKKFQPEPRRFSMRGLLISMAGMSIICALLVSFDVGWVLYAASLIFAGGRIVDFYLTAYFTTSREGSDSLEG